MLLKQNNDNVLLAYSSYANACELTKLHQEFGRFMEPLNGDIDEKNITFDKLFKEGNLPPGGVRERYHHLSIFVKSDLVGFMEIYDGHPCDGIIYIGSLYLGHAHQRKGYGQKVFHLLQENLVMQKSARAMRTAVDLKNWPAIFFWVSLGFTKITKLVGDKILAPEHFAKFELERSLIHAG